MTNGSSIFHSEPEDASLPVTVAFDGIPENGDFCIACQAGFYGEAFWCSVLGLTLSLSHSPTLSLSDSVVVDFNAFCLTLLFVVALNYMPFLGAGLLDVKRPPPSTSNHKRAQEILPQPSFSRKMHRSCNRRRR